jgi:hypothetical protein
MANIYTIISYTPSEDSWYDRNDNYHSGKESIMQILYFNDLKKAGEAFGTVQFANRGGENTLLINGIELGYFDSSLISEEVYKELEKEYDVICDIASIKHRELEEDNKRKLQEAQLLKIQEEERKKRAEQLRIENNERAELAKLMAKYGK